MFGNLDFDVIADFGKDVNRSKRSMTAGVAVKR